MTEKKEISRIILGYLQENGSFPELISRRIAELGITPNDVFKAYLENFYAKEPTEFLVKNAKDITLDENAWKLFIYRIKRNPNVSSELMNCFYHKDKNFYINIMDNILSMIANEDISEQEESNLLYFMEENKIWI